jgi:hypothetical protein
MMFPNPAEITPSSIKRGGVICINAAHPDCIRATKRSATELTRFMARAALEAHVGSTESSTDTFQRLYGLAQKVEAATTES